MIRSRISLSTFATSGFKRFPLLNLTTPLLKSYRSLFAAHTKKKGFHSKPQIVCQPDMKIRIIPALQDNYMYLLMDEETKECAAIDPVEPDKIVKAVKEEECSLTSVLTTHHHWDHASGNDNLVKLVPDSKVIVYGGDDRVPALTNKVKHDDKFKIGNLNVKCLFTPCHTTGHICYYVTSSSGEQPAVFTGDTLFVGGCGKFFEGTPEMMHTALVKILSKLPGNTRVFCGHEYTVNNFKYALHVEPDNKELEDKMKWAKERRAQNCPTIPSTIEDELKTNPFMRVQNEAVQKHCGRSDPVSVMGALREEKNSFRG